MYQPKQMHCRSQRHKLYWPSFLRKELKFNGTSHFLNGPACPSVHHHSDFSSHHLHVICIWWFALTKAVLYGERNWLAVNVGRHHKTGLKLLVLHDCMTGYIQVLYSAQITHMLSGTGIGAACLVVPTVMKCYLGKDCTLNVHHWCWLFDLTVPIQSADWHLWHDQEVRTGSTWPQSQSETIKWWNKVLYSVLAISWMDKHDMNLLLTVHKPKIVITEHSPQH